MKRDQCSIVPWAAYSSEQHSDECAGHTTRNSHTHKSNSHDSAIRMGATPYTINYPEERDDTGEYYLS